VTFRRFVAAWLEANDPFHLENNKKKLHFKYHFLSARHKQNPIFLLLMKTVTSTRTFSKVDYLGCFIKNVTFRHFYFYKYHKYLSKLKKDSE